MPKLKSCTPPIPNIITTSDGQPNADVPGTTKALIKTKIAPNIANINDANPKMDTNNNGVCENATIPSIEYLTNPQKDQDVVPATPSVF